MDSLQHYAKAVAILTVVLSRTIVPDFPCSHSIGSVPTESTRSAVQFSRLPPILNFRGQCTVRWEQFRFGVRCSRKFCEVVFRISG
jgi:hypothetical protein